MVKSKAPAVVRLNRKSHTYSEFYQVESTSVAGRYYVVARKTGGGWECGCPAWTHRTPRVDCKHILLVRRQLNVAPVPAIAPDQPLHPAVEKALTRFSSLEV